jgi:trimeric autotransporter adhesin
MMGRTRLARSFLFLLLVSMGTWSAWAAGPAFQTSSAPRILRLEGLTELAGTVVYSVTNPSATTVLAANSSLSIQYSAPISTSASGSGVVTCTIAGVTGACPASVVAQVSGNNVNIGFSSAVTFSSPGDGLQVVQIRLNVSGLTSGSTVTAILSGTSSSVSNPITLTNSQLIVASGVYASLDPTASTFTGSSNGAFACNPPGNTAMTFSVSVKEAINGAFSSFSEEVGLAASPAPTNGANIELVLSNVPTGLTVAATSTSGSSPTLTFQPLPPAITQTTTGAPMIISVGFASTSSGQLETAVITFSAGFTSPINLASLVGPITARARLGPVSTAATSPPVVVSFVDNTIASGTPFTIVPCALAIQGPSTIKFQMTTGTGPSPAQTTTVYEQRANGAAYTATPSTTSGGNWLSVSPTSGVTPDTLSVVFDATNVSPGIYNGQITVGAVGSTSVVLQTQLTVAAVAPTIALNQTSLTFSGQAGGSSPASQSTNISNSGTGTTFNWTTTASTTSGGNWLTASPASGSGSGSITASVNTAGLAVGQYNGTIQVLSAGATNSPQTISVVLTVNAAPTIALSGTSLSFTTAASSSPPSQTLQVTNSGVGTLGLNVSATTTSGGNWLSVTPTTGTAPLALTVSPATTSLAPGNYQGTITIAATAGSGAVNSPQTVNVSVAVGTPVISSGGVVGAASYVPNASVPPGSIGSIFGVRLAAGSASGGTPLPFTLGGTQVFLNGVISCPLFSVSPTQINFQMPVDAVGATANLTVVSNNLSSAPIVVPTGSVYPGIFTTNSAGTGQAAALNGDYSPNSATNPTPAGSSIFLYLTGLGSTNPAFATGQPGSANPPLNQTLITPTVLINGVSANVGFSGLAPTFVGLYQVNATIPQGTPSGLVNVQVVANGVSSNIAQIAVK